MAIEIRHSSRPGTWRARAALLTLAVIAGAVRPCTAQLAAPAGGSATPVVDDYAAHILAGISNEGRNKLRPYVTAGDRTYLIGTQDGNFPDMGQHIPGEMGGLWLPPVKLVDGFEARIADVTTGRDVLLSDSAEMVAYPYGTLFRYGRALHDLEIDRFQFSPDKRPGLVVQYRFTNWSDHARRLRLQWSVKTDLRPGWYADHLGIQDGGDAVAWHPDKGIFVARDLRNSWYCVWGAVPSRDARRVDQPPPMRTRGNGVTAATSHPLTVGAHATATLTFIISGSTTAQSDAVTSFESLAAEYASLLAQKVAHYRSIINTARITVPDRRLQEVYNWSRINMQWLVRDVPGIGRGLSGGFVEYPWWFGTETYSLQALTATGDFELAKQTLRLLRNVSNRVNADGRIVHEITPDGQVPNRGNTQETAQFLMTAGKLFEWTGDRNFAREMYPAMKRGIEWLLGEMDQNKDLFPEGYGIMEVYGLNAELIDVAVYTQQALEAAARIAGALQDTDGEDRYSKLASELKARINQRFWIARDSTYANFYGSKADALRAVEGAIKQINLNKGGGLTAGDKAAVAHYEQLKAEFAAQVEGDRGWITNKNWVIATPMETGIAPPERALSLLDTIRRENSGDYGPYLSAVERRAMMTISTGVQAVAEGRYGRTNEAMWYVDRIVRTFNRVTPGSISEIMPDKGCFAIAWTSYGIVVPVVEHVFGVRPDAPHKTIILEPHFPSGWEDISIEDLPIGTNLISFARARTPEGVNFDIRAKENGWSFILRAGSSSNSKILLNGKAIDPSPSGVRMYGKKNRVLITSP